MSVSATAIEGLYVIQWSKISDERGWFKHSYQRGELREALGREPQLCQGNHSRSGANVLRGFHLEPWDKLIYVPRGTAQIVVADVRPTSATFGATESFLVGDAPGEHLRVFVSQGLANAFYAITETDYLNDVSSEYHPTGRRGVAWDDPTLNVRWPGRRPVLSEADSSQPTLQALFPDHPLFAVSGAPGRRAMDAEERRDPNLATAPFGVDCRDA